jgi:hypothetical protein
MLLVPVKVANSLPFLPEEIRFNSCNILGIVTHTVSHWLRSVKVSETRPAFGFRSTGVPTKFFRECKRIANSSRPFIGTSKMPYTRGIPAMRVGIEACIGESA